MLDTGYAWLDVRMTDREWAVGGSFTLADCAAAPALFYADRVNERRAFRRLDSYIEGDQGPAEGSLRGLSGPDRARRLAPTRGDDGRDPRIRRSGRRRVSHVAVLPAG